MPQLEPGHLNRSMADISIETECIKVDQSSTFVGTKCEFRRLLVGYDGSLTDLFVDGRVGTELEKHAEETVGRIEWVERQDFRYQGYAECFFIEFNDNRVATS